jgi:hypothetical protein
MSRSETPIKPRAFDGAPAYFRRSSSRTMSALGVAGGPLTIYGVADMYSYPEDREIERDMWEKRGTFGARCFSTPCPDGEFGYVPASDVEVITGEEFAAVRDAGWS